MGTGRSLPREGVTEPPGRRYGHTVSELGSMAFCAHPTPPDTAMQRCLVKKQCANGLVSD